MPEKKKKIIAFSDIYVAYFIQNEFGNRGAGEEKNLEFLGKNSLGERRGGEARELMNYVKKKYSNIHH